jgi:hypothetical protein
MLCYVLDVNVFTLALSRVISTPPYTRNLNISMILFFNIVPVTVVFNEKLVGIETGQNRMDMEWTDRRIGKQ